MPKTPEFETIEVKPKDGKVVSISSVRYVPLADGGFKLVDENPKPIVDLDKSGGRGKP